MAMAQGLNPLIRFNKRALDEKQRALAVLQSQHEALAEERIALDRALAAEAKAASTAPDFAFAFANYAAATRQRQKAIGEKMRRLETEIEAAREAIRDGFRELKTYEIAQANRDEAERKALAQKVATELDEIAITVTQRRKAEDDSGNAP
jgi:flagellar protein FliJ